MSTEPTKLLERRKQAQAKELVDQLAELRGLMAHLAAKESEIIEALDRTTLDRIEGEQFNAAISRVEEGLIPDWKKIALKLKPSQQLINANRKKRAGYVSVRLSARSKK